MPAVALSMRQISFWRDWWWCWRLARDPVVVAGTLSARGRPPGLWRHMRWMLRWSGRGRSRQAHVIEIELIGGGLSRRRRCGLWRVAYSPATDLCEVSLALHRDYRGLGIGRRILRDASNVAHECGLRLHARILLGNRASLRAFRRAGYRVVGVAGRGEDGTPPHYHLVYEPSSVRPPGMWYDWPGDGRNNKKKIPEA